MKVIDGTFKCYALDAKESFSDEYLEGLPVGTGFAIQSGNLFKMVKTPLYTFLAGVENQDKIVKSLNLEDEVSPHYNKNLGYLLTHEYENSMFSLSEFIYCMKYFREIYDKFGTEAAVLLYYNEELSHWTILYVLQTGASGGAVTYIYPHAELPLSLRNNEEAQKLQEVVNLQHDELIERGYNRAGTIHSHCNFGAFHSGTDDADEVHFDGLHITIGNVRSGWSFAHRFMIGGFDFKISDEIMAGMLDLSSMSELSDLVESDEQEISEHHMNLLFKTPAVVVKSTKNYSGHFHQPKFACWDNEADVDTVETPWWNGGSYSVASSVDSYDPVYKTRWNIECINEDDAIRLYDREQECCIWVTRQYYKEYRHKFSSSRFVTPNASSETTKEMFLLNAPPMFDEGDASLPGNYCVANLASKPRRKAKKKK